MPEVLTVKPTRLAEAVLVAKAGAVSLDFGHGFSQFKHRAAPVLPGSWPMRSVAAESGLLE